MLHDTKKSKSLLKQLRIKDRIQYRDSSGSAISNKNIVAQFPLVVTRIEADGSDQGFGLQFRADGTLDHEWYEQYVLNAAPVDSMPNVVFEPRFEGGPPKNISWRFFDNWWQQRIILEPPQHDRRRRSISRKELILAMANQDGGAHVDPSLDETYAAITRQHSLGLYASSGRMVAPIGAPHEASAIQVGYEVLASLVRWVPEDIPVGLLETVKSWSNPEPDG
ncbi:MAG: hypothetical protein ACOC5M_02895 [Chloroflexota bacterium]